MALSFPEPLTAAHNISDFSCGKPALDRWLKARALSNQEKGFTAVLVVNAVGDEAAAFWVRRGFTPAKHDPLILYRSISDIAATLAAI